MGNYIPSTPAQQKEMLEAVGCKNLMELFSHLPEGTLLDRPLNLPEGLSESQVIDELAAMSEKNTIFKSIFRGAGAYNHYIPAIVKSVVSKEDFVTAYTPYQAEISQGILQSIFEFQTMICELTGMEASNASVYDGATAAAEAVAMCRERKRSKALISATAHPDVIETVRTYCFGSNAELVVIPAKDGKTDMAALTAALDETVACFYVQQPNFYGIIEDAVELGEAVHAAGAKYIMGCNPITLLQLATPADCGADIAVGDGQPLGMSLAFGGPYLGFMSCKMDMSRKLPGRIVGETEDIDGKRAYVLTLQAREQHIRREKASSNICSNQALCALTASVYMAAMGTSGLETVAEHCVSKAHYLAEKLSGLGFAVSYDAPFFHEFVTSCPIPAEKLLAKLADCGILGPYSFASKMLSTENLPKELDNALLWCVTEQNSLAQINELLAAVKEAIV